MFYVVFDLFGRLMVAHFADEEMARSWLESVRGQTICELTDSESRVDALLDLHDTLTPAGHIWPTN